MKWLEHPLHPLFISAYPILALAATNIQELPAIQAGRALLFVGLVSALGVITLRAILRSWVAAGILTSALLLLFFSYGHIYDLIKNLAVGEIIIGRHRYLALAWIGLAVITTLFLRKADPGGMRRITSVLNAFGLVLLLFPVCSMALYALRWHSAESGSGDVRGPSALHFTKDDSPPDIYYIVLDSYGREDVLRSLYGIDNADFINALRERDFYVADQAVANHVSTGFSLASSLNLDYIQNLGIELPPGTYPGPLIDPIRGSTVRAELERLGYTIVALASGWTATSLIDADYFLTPEMLAPEGELGEPGFHLNDFESLLLETTPIRILIDYSQSRQLNAFLEGIASMSGREDHRQLVLAAFAHLESMPSIPGPKFVFAHIISPHRPYLFGPEGEYLVLGGPSTFSDTSLEADSAEESQEYGDQLLYINKRTLQVVDRLLSESTSEPVIIIQADTGPAFGMDWDAPDPINLRAKEAILSAFYFPYGCDQVLYPRISPVNTFRVLFNCYFDGSYELLADQTYFTNHHSSAGYEFVPMESMTDSSGSSHP